MTNFGAKLEYLLSSRAEIISRMHRPPAAEGNDLEQLLGEEPIPKIPVPEPNVPIWPDEKAAAYCVLTPPLETFMVVPDDIRREQFFHTARQDDMLIGFISAIQDSGLIITLLAYDQGPRRDFDGLKLTGFCPVRQLQRYSTHGNALDAFKMGEKVRAFILDVHHTGRLILSMNPKALNNDLFGELKLGIITDDDLPFHYKKLQNLDGKSFEACLEGTPQFRNPDGLRVLCSRFGIPRASGCSLLLSMAKINLPKPEMACELRRIQLYNMSMKHVAQGVKYFKEGRNTEAVQCYNFAIEVENTNPDAYVARGALYASIGTYAKALEDLDRSLNLQPNHANAKNYLGQTLLAYACELTNKDPTKAEQLLKRAVKLDPENEEAREALRELPGSGGQSRDTSMRSWSRTPSPNSKQSKYGSGVIQPTALPHHRSGRSPIPSVSPSVGQNNPNPAVISHFERSRVALEKLVEADKMRKDLKRVPERERSPDFYSIPSHLTGGHRYGDVKSHEDGRRSDRGGGGGKGDLAKIVITRNQSGRTIRCQEQESWREEDQSKDREPQKDQLKRRNDWKEFDDTDAIQDERDQPNDSQIPQAEYKYDRRVFTPPKDAKEVENGVLVQHYKNDNDLPLTSKTLQERVQQRLKDIERRHRVGGGDGPPPPLPPQNVAGGPENSFGGHPGNGPPPGNSHWRGGRGGFQGGDIDRRGPPQNQPPFRNDNFHPRGGGGNFYNRGGRGGPRGGPRWRGGYNDDWRGGRRGGGNWGNRDNRYSDRREPIPVEERSRRRQKHYSGGGTGDRSRSLSDRSKSRSPATGGGAASGRGVSSRRDHSRSPQSRSHSRSTSPLPARGSRRRRSYSRSGSRSPSPFPKKRFSRARIRTPPLAPLTNRHSESEEQMADVEQFVAQLQAKRQMQQELSNQPTIGPQMPEGGVVVPSAQD